MLEPKVIFTTEENYELFKSLQYVETHTHQRSLIENPLLHIEYSLN